MRAYAQGGHESRVHQTLTIPCFCSVSLLVNRFKGCFDLQVNYINAHATSTVVGDLAEIKGIKKVFKNTSELKINATKVTSLLPPYPTLCTNDYPLVCDAFLWLSVYDRALLWCCWRLGSYCHCQSDSKRVVASFH